MASWRKYASREVLLDDYHWNRTRRVRSKHDANTARQNMDWSMIFWQWTTQCPDHLSYDEYTRLVMEGRMPRVYRHNGGRYHTR